MDPAKEKLISDLAAQAELVLRNVRLVEDLRGSRRRLVSAQDEERRKLERNIGWLVMGGFLKPPASTRTP